MELSRLKLVIFDVDGTLVDSQADILAAMGAAFGALNLTCPSRVDVLSIVGLSLDQAMIRLAPDVGPAGHDQLVTAYKEAYTRHRADRGAAVSSPLYPGAMDVLRSLEQVPEVLLGVATGKSQRGLDFLLEAHGLTRTFITRQVADHHPSKPHPSMVLAAMAETGVDPADTVMIGDTSFDMDMAQAAGVTGIGVSWGYHPARELRAARQVVDTFDALPATLRQIWDETK